MKITFHRFNIGDVEDPDIVIAGPMLEWQETAKGQWVMEHARDLRYHTQPDDRFWGSSHGFLKQLPQLLNLQVLPVQEHRPVDAITRYLK